MKLLIDTHVFIWMQTDVNRLSITAQAALADTRNQLYVSAVVAWELAIKVPLKKFTLADPVELFVVEGIRRTQATELPVTVRHAAAVGTLPLHHADPFDRLLVAQARVEGMTLVTVDHKLPPYGVPILW